MNAGTFTNGLPRLGVAGALVLGAALVITPARSQAQSYSIDWSKIAGGGGTSTGGLYSVSGTIGQADAGTLSGGNYTLQGGFWGIVSAIQTPGAPYLTVLRTDTNSVVVSWSLPADGWVLEQTPSLGNPSTWTQVSPPYQTNSTQSWLTVPAPTGNRFYRLYKP